MKESKWYGAVGIIMVFLVLIMDSNNHSNQKEPSMDSVNNPVSTTSDNRTRYLTRLDEIKKNRIKNMKNIKKSGNATVDFFNGLISLHHSTILIADNYLRNDESKFKDLANNVIASRNEQITQVKNLTVKYESENHKNEDKENAFLEDYLNLLDKNRQPMGESKKSSLDIIFLNKMIEHNKIAIDMAKSILEYTDYEEIRTLARNIISSMEQETDELIAQK